MADAKDGMDAHDPGRADGGVSDADGEDGEGAIPPAVQGEVTLLLRRMGAGDSAAVAAVIPLMYTELRRLARSHMRRERDGHTLQATALVHEVYLKMAQQHAVQWESRGHFLCIAARMMRRILVDSSRRRTRKKRGAGEWAPDAAELDLAAPEPFAAPVDVLALHEAMERLGAIDERLVQVVELRFFAGLSNSEVAAALGISEPSVKRRWVTARAWLYQQMQAS